MQSKQQNLKNGITEVELEKIDFNLLSDDDDSNNNKTVFTFALDNIFHQILINKGASYNNKFLNHLLIANKSLLINITTKR